MINYSLINESQKGAILIHGRHLETNGWSDIVFGDLEKMGARMGQVPTGLNIARDLDIDLVIFGTGASEKDGLLEADYTLNETLKLAEPIVRILNTKLGEEKRFRDEDEFRGWLKKIAITETKSKNTFEEVKFCLDVVKRHKKCVVYQVSSPSHLARCMIEWIKYREENGGDIICLPIASDTYYNGAGPNDIAIVEYPHRGDAPLFATYQYVKKIFELYSKEEVEVVNFLEDFGKLLGKYGVDTKDITPYL